VGAVFKSLCKDTYYSPHGVRLRRERPLPNPTARTRCPAENQSMISSSHRIYRVPRCCLSLGARRVPRCRLSLRVRLESSASSSHFPSRISRSICHRCRRTSSPRKAIPNSHSHRLIVAYMLILSMEVVCSFIEHSIQYGTEQSLPLFCKLAQQWNQRGLALVLLHHGLDERLPLVGLAPRIVRPLDHFQPIGGEGIVS
jgi:hypothetical protein